jgi:hypothetical protein
LYLKNQRRKKDREHFLFKILSRLIIWWK